jgi:LacI family transcriptional regulator
MASIYDVAKEAGVSVATVSRTFSAPGLITAQTQKRVLDVARRLNYQPRRSRARQAAEAGAATTANAIGFQFFAAQGDTLQSNTFYAPILAGAQAEAASLGLHVLVHSTDRHSLYQELPKMVLERAVGGMLLVGTADPAILATFAAHVPEIVVVDHHDPRHSYECVVSDGFGGAYAAAQYLIDLGHRRVGFYLPERHVSSFDDRLRGYLCALFDAGLPGDRRLVMTSFDKGEPGSFQHQMASPNRPTAIMTVNDQNAFNIMYQCRELGLRIPDDVSLIGFDDISFSTHTDPPLTTVRVDKELMGRLAVHRLYARLQSGASDIASHPICSQVPVSLVIRSSCKAPAL